MPRTIIVGDVHGCRRELSELLTEVGFQAGDRLVMVGDLVTRGPDPAGLVELLLSVGARSVRGNHEDRLLRWRRRPERHLGPTHKVVVDALKERHWVYLESLPLWLDLPEHGVRVVHAGLIPGVPIEKQDPRTLMYVRCLAQNGRPIEERGETLWGTRYTGPPHVVFGHNAMSEPQIHEDATGIDTGAVYGHRLTAMVLEEGQRVPPASERKSVLRSVQSKTVYAQM
ncbi:Bis(5'-nucleosyl)-tetraphosphatase, symmetrical [Minicystis rosea]|nr:Bis(5'-nucleosyl)-tetraphosphatase, symmetrical [Minicystis rosea]